MRRVGLYFYSLLLIFGLTWSLSTPLFAQELERIRSFDSIVEVKDTGELEVTETIRYDFGQNERHGIFRTIPRIFESGGNKYRLKGEFILVSDEEGEEYHLKLSKTQKMYTLQIGEADRTISGEHTYVIKYNVLGAISPFDEFDELYWNATGNEWDVSIDHAALRVILPAEVDVEEGLRTHCYQGSLGSNLSCGEVGVSVGGGVTVVDFSAKDLDPGGGITGAVGFPKGVVPEPVRDLVGLPPSWVITISFLFGVCLLVFIAWSIGHWNKLGRDPRGRSTIVRQYDAPKGMMPAEIGIVVDEKINNRDITAEIVYLAERGFMHIMAVPRNSFLARGSSYYLLKLREPDETLKSYQRLLLEFLFSARRTMSSLEKDKFKEKVENNKKIKVDKSQILEKIEFAKEITGVDELGKPDTHPFYEDLNKVKKELEKVAVSGGLFDKTPTKVSSKYAVIMVLGMGIGILFSILFSILQSMELVVVSIIAGAVVFIVGIILSTIMVRKTDVGVEVREHALGLKEYLSIAEKDRLEFHFDPRKNPDLFEKLLPFAIALGVEKRWSRELDNVHISPTWYSDTGTNTLTIASFNSSFSGFNTASSSVYSAASYAGSAGGGFSGGGVGGGGGGSW